MPTQTRVHNGSKYRDYYRSPKHVDAQAFLDAALLAIHQFHNAMQPLLSKNARNTLDAATRQARAALSSVTLTDLWDSLDTDDAVGAPWQTILVKGDGDDSDDQTFG